MQLCRSLDYLLLHNYFVYYYTPAYYDRKVYYCLTVVLVLSTTTNYKSEFPVVACFRLSFRGPWQVLWQYLHLFPTVRRVCISSL
jgi:hypothetical protein